MDIVDIQPYRGRNIYSHKPVIKVTVDLGELYDSPTCELAGFNEHLIQALPGLASHFCATGREGGFLDRLKGGTYLTHVTEHIVLELQCISGDTVCFGRSRVLKEPAIYYMVFEYKNEKFAIECLLTAVRMVNDLIAGRIPDMDRIRLRLAGIRAQTCLGPSTQAIWDEAVRRGIPVRSCDHSGILQLGTGKFTRYTEASLTDSPGCIAVDIAGNKHMTKGILKESGIPVPEGDIAYTEEAARTAADIIGYPVAVKPFDANQGKGVTTGICDASGVDAAFRSALKYSRAAIVERHIPGRDYRLLVVGGRLSAAAERIPPYITGDGSRSVRELVEEENSNPLRGYDHEKPLTRIRLDEPALGVLARQGMDENSIPPSGKRITLRYNGNLSTGGTARDCTDEVHQENVQLAVRCAQLLQLDVAGIDITCRDISSPLSGDNGAVIEVNAAPGLRMHLYPTEGAAHDVASDILDQLFPDPGCAAIPVVSVTGTNGKTTVARMIAHVLSTAGIQVGMTNTSGIYIGRECVLPGDNTGAFSAARVLRDRSIDAAVLETARGGILKRGLGYDLADVGVVVNISGDHLGLDGIHTIEELVHVKALVAEAVKPDGVAVLNAEDPATPVLMKRAKSEVLLFSQDRENELLLRHLSEGKPAVYVLDGAVCRMEKGVKSFVVRLEDLPITFGGKAKCNIENALAAIAALLSLKLPADVIRNGAASFMPDLKNNPGRFNLIGLERCSILLDYGHNPAGLKALVQVMQQIGSGRFTGIVGMPGDRRDEDIAEFGRICAEAFDRLIIKEDRDLRGRNPGEVSDILFDAVVRSGMAPDSITVIFDEAKALETAAAEARDGELIVMLYEELEPVLESIRRLKGVPDKQKAAEREGSAEAEETA